MYNRIILMGRIASNLELKTTQSGNSVLSFRLAVDRKYQPNTNDHVTDFINIVAWRNNAEFIAKYFSKGHMIHIEGELQTRSYQDNDGRTVYVTEVLVDSVSFTGEKASDNTAEQSASKPKSVTAEVPSNVQDKLSENEYDDYPF